MPRQQTTNTSILGLQRLGSFPVENTFWELRLASNPQQDRQERLGTVLHVRPAVNNRFPVIAADPLYGSGAAPPRVDIPTYVGTEVWVIWFRAGIVWVFEREGL